MQQAALAGCPKELGQAGVQSLGWRIYW